MLLPASNHLGMPSGRVWLVELTVYELDGCPCPLNNEPPDADDDQHIADLLNLLCRPLDARKLVLVIIHPADSASQRKIRFGAGAVHERPALRCRYLRGVVRNLSPRSGQIAGDRSVFSLIPITAFPLFLFPSKPFWGICSPSCI